MFKMLITYFWVFYTVAFCAALIGWGVCLIYVTCKFVQGKSKKKHTLLMHQLRQQNKPNQLWW